MPNYQVSTYFAPTTKQYYLSPSVYTVHFIPNHFRHTVPKNMIEKCFVAYVGAVLPSWQGQRGEKQILEKEPGTRNLVCRNMKGISATFQRNGDVAHSPPFSDRKSHGCREKAFKMYHVRGHVHVWALSLCPRVPLWVNHCIIEGEQKRNISTRSLHQHILK